MPGGGEGHLIKLDLTSAMSFEGTLNEALVRIERTSKLRTLLRLAGSARTSNPRTRGVMAAPPTITADGTSLPAGQSNAYTYTAKPASFRVAGGQIITSGSTGGRVKSAVIAATGGNIGSSDGAQGSYSRISFMADAAKVTFRVGPTTAKYRFLVDDQYADLTGTQTVATTGSTNEYISLTFAGRARRKITLEMHQNGQFVGVYVGATESVYPITEADTLRSVLLGDSYVYGSNTIHLGDAFGAVMADHLGIRAHTNSGSGGTGWATANASYRFDERIARGDLLLGGAPDVVFLMGSYNDRNNDSATVTANALTGLRLARAQAPYAFIFVFGAFPANTGPSAGILAAENAVAAAVASFNDPLCKFIPVSTDTTGAWISGTGRIGATSGTGNSDIFTDTDATHPPDIGHAYLGQRCADAVLSAAEALAPLIHTLS